ncbi:hypothetical protein GCM10023237_21710 [Streptomyces coeruleoprunus]
MQDETEKTSSRILDMLGVKGEVTQPGSMILACSGYESGEKVNRARHPWSLYKVPYADLEKAMDRLRAELPKNGWTIVKDGVTESQAKRPQVVAESEGREFAVDVRLHKADPARNQSAFMEVTVESACFRAK